MEFASSLLLSHIKLNPNIFNVRDVECVADGYIANTSFCLGA